MKSEHCLGVISPQNCLLEFQVCNNGMLLSRSCQHRHRKERLCPCVEKSDLKLRFRLAAPDTTAHKLSTLATRLTGSLSPVPLQEPTSWVLANMAALYWRVEGDAVRAVDCLRLALTHAPREVKDTSLISLANILHQAGHLNDAIVVTAAALDVTNRLPVSHFTLANLYAAKVGEK